MDILEIKSKCLKLYIFGVLIEEEIEWGRIKCKQIIAENSSNLVENTSQHNEESTNYK